MAPKARAPMPRENRAKQFMPFAALKGLPEALRKKEKIRVPRKEIPEDKAAEIDAALQGLERGQVITVVYYCNEEYIQLTGAVSRLDTQKRILQLVKTRILIDDIVDVFLDI